MFSGAQVATFSARAVWTAHFCASGWVLRMWMRGTAG